MDRFEWCDGSLYTGEQLVEQQTGVALYDGPEKVINQFDIRPLIHTSDCPHSQPTRATEKSSISLND